MHTPTSALFPNVRTPPPAGPPAGPPADQKIRTESTAELNISIILVWRSTCSSRSSIFATSRSSRRAVGLALFAAWPDFFLLKNIRFCDHREQNRQLFSWFCRNVIKLIENGKFIPRHVEHGWGCHHGPTSLATGRYYLSHFLPQYVIFIPSTFLYYLIIKNEKTLENSKIWKSVPKSNKFIRFNVSEIKGRDLSSAWN